RAVRTRVVASRWQLVVSCWSSVARLQCTAQQPAASNHTCCLPLFVRGARLGEQALDERRDLFLRLGVELAARLAREPGVRAAPLAVPSEVERRRERVEVHRLRQLVAGVLRLAGQQHGVADAVALVERAQPHWILELRFLLERERDDLQTARLVLLIELDEE